MPRGGHNAKPSAFRALTGNPGRRQLIPHEPQPAPLELSMLPGLDAHSRQCWERTAPILADMGS
jgi:hypothetical protein